MIHNLNFKTIFLGLSLFCSSTSALADGAFSKGEETSIEATLAAISNYIDIAVKKAVDLAANKGQNNNTALSENLLSTTTPMPGIQDYLQVLKIDKLSNILIQFVSRDSADSGNGGAIANQHLFGKRILLMPDTNSQTADISNDPWLCQTDFDSDLEFAGEADNTAIESQKKVSAIARFSDNTHLGNCEYVSIAQMNKDWAVAINNM